MRDAALHGEAQRAGHLDQRVPGRREQRGRHPRRHVHGGERELLCAERCCSEAGLG